MTAVVAAASGFITSRSSLGADLSLLASVTAAALLTAGVVLAVRRRYSAHRWVQTGAVALNGVVAISWMTVSLARFILPGLPGTLHEHGHLLAAVHASVGVVGVVLGVTLAVLGNARWSRGESLRAYRTPMRIAYAFYMTGVALGIALYVVTYG